MQKKPGKPAPSQKKNRGTAAKNPPQLAPLQNKPVTVAKNPNPISSTLSMIMYN